MELTAITQATAERLRYRELSNIVGRIVRIRKLSTIESDIRQAFKDVLPPQCELVETYSPASSIWRFGFITLDFAVSDVILATDYEIGLESLRKLEFIDRSERGWFDDYMEDPTGLTDLLEDLTLEKIFFKIELDTDKRPDRSRWAKRSSATLPRGFFPCDFTVRRACFTNSALVWMNTYGVGITWM